jgi:hypothetical protein
VVSSPKKRSTAVWTVASGNSKPLFLASPSLR